MKILHINSAKYWGGGEVYTFTLCQRLKTKGHEVVLACRPTSAIGEVFKENGISILELPLKGAADIKSAQKLAAYCHQNGIDIVHAHLARDYWIASFLKFFYSKIRLVFTRHLLNPIPSTFLRRLILKKVDKVIAVSEAVKDELIKQNLFPASRIIRIYNGIDVGRFESAKPGKIRKDLGLNEHNKLIGTVGQISPHKGSDIFIKSAAEIAKSYPDAKFILVGDDFRNGEYIQELTQLSIELGIGDQVIFLGPRSDIPEVMKDLDIFVLASRNEPFGLVITEAMAAGVPVIVTKAGGAKEIVDETTGLLVDVGQPAALVAAIESLLKNESLAKQFGNAGRVRAIKMFGLDRMVDEIMAVYNEVLLNAE